MAEREVKRRKLQEELEGYEEDGEVGQAKTPRLSLPLNVESLANRHNQQQQNKLIIPIHAPSAEMKEQIKARFSIGQIEESTNQPSSKPSPVASRLSLSSTPSASPIKRKRRLTGSLLKPSPSISPSISGNNNNIKNESIPVMISPLPIPKPTIVFTSMAPVLRKQCMEVINRLGKLEIASK
jgi:hypothetical protein